MPGINGETLRAWRRSQGWDVPEMARQLRRVAQGPIADHDGLIRMIRDWERGRHKLTERYQLLYAAALGIEPDRLTHVPSEPPQLDPAVSLPPATVSTVTGGDVAVIRVMLDSLTASDRQFGGGNALAHAMDYLRSIVMPRVDAQADEQVQQDLYTVAVEFNLRASSMQMDAGNARESRRLLGAAFPIAQETATPIVSAWVLARCGEQLIQDGNAPQALAYTRGAVAMAAQSAPAAQSFILVKHALALSMTGDRAETMRALRDAWNAHGRAGSTSEPLWMSMYGVEHLQHDEGRCYNNLGLGDQAVRAAEDSLKIRKLSRPRAFSLAVKARGHAQGPHMDLDLACDAGRELVGITSEINSGRVRIELAKVLTALRPYKATPAVRDLLETAHPVMTVKAS